MNLYMLFILINYVNFNEGAESLQGEQQAKFHHPSGQSQNSHHNGQSKQNHNDEKQQEHVTETVTMSQIQLEQLVAVAKIAFENAEETKVKQKLKEKEEKVEEIEDAEELFACTHESLKFKSDLGMCYLIHKIKIFLKPMTCYDMNLRIMATIDNHDLILYFSQSSRMLAFAQEKSNSCTQRLKKYRINESFYIIVLDNVISKVDSSKIDSHVSWMLLKSFDIFSCFLFIFGILDLEKNEILYGKALMMASAFILWGFCICDLKVRLNEYWKCEGKKNKKK